MTITKIQVRNYYVDKHSESARYAGVKIANVEPLGGDMYRLTTQQGRTVTADGSDWLVVIQES